MFDPFREYRVVMGERPDNRWALWLAYAAVVVLPVLALYLSTIRP